MNICKDCKHSFLYDLESPEECPKCGGEDIRSEEDYFDRADRLYEEHRDDKATGDLK